MLVRRVITRVLDDALADLERQVQAGKGRISLFELLHNAQRVKIVIKRKPVFAHLVVKRLLPGVTEGWMPDVVDERERFHELGIESKLAGNGAGDLGNFDGVCQAIAEMVGIASAENLGLVFQSAERPCV